MMMQFDLTPLLTVAQAADSPPLPGQVGPEAETTADGSPAGQPGGGGQSPLGSNFMLLLLGAVALMFVFSMMGQRREKKKREALMGGIKKHDRVQTIGGVIGSVVEVKGDTVVLKVDESSNTRITFARSAVQQVISQKEEQAKPLANVAENAP